MGGSGARCWVDARSANSPCLKIMGADVAITGEISLCGLVLPVGGIKDHSSHPGRAAASSRVATRHQSHALCRYVAGNASRPPPEGFFWPNLCKFDAARGPALTKVMILQRAASSNVSLRSPLTHGSRVDGSTLGFLRRIRKVSGEMSQRRTLILGVANHGT